MRRLDWGIGVRRPWMGIFRRAGLVLLTVIGFIAATAAGDPAEANRKYAAIVIDGKSGEVLFSRKADYRRYPASLTKVMTLYMLFEALEKGEIKLTDMIPVSKHAAGMPPSKLGVKAGEKISVEKAIAALVVRSANDVAAAVGEKLGGTEYKFALEMTKKAKAIGMKRTRFRNASGLYHRSQVTTARDMATLALRIQKDFPQYYHYFKLMKVSWKGRTWSTHNRLMKYFPGADGLKTGYVRASGFNLITSARRGNMHLVGVVMGGRKSRSRDRHMVSILERNFARLLKRDEYVYPIADRLPEVRPKPDFAAMDSQKWLLKTVGVMPRPNPFAREDAAQAVIAELKANPPAEVLEPKPEKPAETKVASAAPAARAPKNNPPRPAANGRAAATSAGTGGPELAAPAEEKAEAPSLPPLAASGTGTLPAGTGAPVTAADASTGRQEKLAAATPATIRPASPDDAIAQLIEEGDGQIASADLSGQMPAAASGDATTGGKTVQLASAAPAATHAAAALASSRDWGVQVGAFTSVELAEIHLDNAERLKPDVLTRDKSALVPKQDPSGELYRARFGPMEEAEAKAACKELREGGMHCFAIEADDWGEAVRR